MLLGSVSCGIDTQVFTQCPLVVDGLAALAGPGVPGRPMASMTGGAAMTAAVSAPAVIRPMIDDVLFMSCASSGGEQVRLGSGSIGGGPVR